jgi:regulator of sigma E protease
MTEILSKCEGRSLRITIMRDESQLDFDISPALEKIQNIYGEDVGERYLVGILPQKMRLGIGEAFVYSIKETYYWGEVTIVGLVKLIQGKLSPTESFGGPILIAQVAGDQLKAGMDSFVLLIALISVNLGLINLFPIPVLDGGHLFFFTIEAVIRRPLNTRMREVAQQIGVFLLVSLMIFVFYNDIHRLISQLKQ